MRYASGITLIMVGGILVYAGFKDVNVWDTFLGVIRGE